MRGARRLKTIERELRAAGYEFVRSGSHRIWRHPTEGIFVVPQGHASEDPRAMRNLRADLKRRKG